jgi:hypothetical protein
VAERERPGSHRAVTVLLALSGIKDYSSFSGFDFGSTWRIYEGYTSPLLKCFLTPLTVGVSGTKTYDGTAASGLTPTASQLAAVVRLSGVQRYDDKNAATGKTLRITSYTITDGNGGNNYNVTTVNTNTSGVISKATLVLSGLTANNKGTTAAAVNGRHPQRRPWRRQCGSDQREI